MCERACVRKIVLPVASLLRHKTAARDRAKEAAGRTVCAMAMERGRENACADFTGQAGMYIRKGENDCTAFWGGG